MRLLSPFPKVFSALPAREKSQANPRRACAPNGVISTQILNTSQALPILERFNFFNCVSLTQINARQRKKIPLKTQISHFFFNKNRTVPRHRLKSAVELHFIFGLLSETACHTPNRMRQIP